MEICGHIILRKEVIGIGPLMIQQSTDQATRMLYNSKKLFFFLHLRNQSVKIESNWFDVGNSEPANQTESRAREDYKKFCAEYDEARKLVIELLESQILQNIGPA